MKKNNKGFTLVELIVVLVILAILAAILTPALLGYIDRARSEKDYSTAQTVRVAAQAAIDQAYGEGKLADNTTPTGGGALTIDTMSGTIAGTKSTAANGTVTYTGGKYVELAYKLATVDKTVTAFSFEYTNGIITGGNVTINGSIYVLKDGAWSVSGN